MSNIKYLVIVESPAKAKTLTKFLGNEYKVLASFGHIRDLPKSRLGFDPNNNFKPEYIVTPDKKRIVTELKKYIKKDTIIYLAADEDREGEAIAWHLIPTLGIEKHDLKRIVFHEITKGAILHAIEHPRELNLNMVDAQQARRILDRAVGYKLSPLLWKKVKYGLSAGRVQSVGVRIVVDREKEIEAFKPEEFWKLKLDILSNPSFKAEFTKQDNKVIKLTNSEEAYKIKNDCDKYDYLLKDIDEKDSYRNPPPPFTTSTLQQEASTKSGLSPKQTMMIAQKLYEGSVTIPNHTGGLITYMRTDSLNLSTVALEAAKKVITSEFGSEYTVSVPRVYSAKGKGKVAAQEAHEAIRPVDMNIKPSDLTGYLDSKELRLYTLIWQRTIATQMQQAKVANTTYKIYGGPNREYEFIAKGTKILFPGFMKAYTEGSDDPDSLLDSREKFLPNVNVGAIFNNTNLTAEQNFTKPLPRYTEASLIKKMEAEGIGRPSTYASTLATILAREYVEITEDKKLIPTVIGRVVTDYLVDNFPEVVDLAFTANIEAEFDRIANGEIKWETVLHNFYDKFDKNVASHEDGERVQYSTDILLGVDNETNLNIYVKTGQHGTYIQLGEKDPDSKVKPKISPVPKGIKPEDITLAMAERYLLIPRVIGKTSNGEEVHIKIGKFGPYLQVGKMYYSVSKDLDLYTLDLKTALDIIMEIDDTRSKALLASYDGTDITILNGRYGPYIKAGKSNYKLPKTLSEEDIKKLSLEEVKKIIANQPVSSGNKHSKKYKR